MSFSPMTPYPKFLLSFALATPTGLLCGGCSSSNAPSTTSAGGSSVAGTPSDIGTAGAAAATGGGASSLGGANSGGMPSGNAGSDNAGATSTVTISDRFPNVGSSVCADLQLRLSFSAPVSTGRAGKIQVFKSNAPATAVAVIDITQNTYRETIEGRPFVKPRPVYIQGNDVIVYLPHGATATPGSYFVTIDSGVFVDAMQHPLPALSDPNAWQFSTKASAPADPAQLTVSREGPGDFCTVQGAVDFVPTANTKPTTITIKNGVYHELVFILNKSALTFHGEDRKQTIIAFTNNDALQQKLGTAYRAMIEAEGSDDLVFENLTLHNTTPQGGSQAEALRIEPGDRAILRNADFISTQDTLLLTGRVYVTNSYVEGNVDFIWGKGTAYFEKSEIKTVGRPGYLVQARNTTNYGYVFVDSTFSTDGMASGTVLARIEADRFPLSNVAYINCKFGPHIAPKGWLITNSMAGTPLDVSKLRFWEYQSTDLSGAPIDVSMRDPASRQISAAEADQARDKNTVFAGWNPSP